MKIHTNIFYKIYKALEFEQRSITNLYRIDFFDRSYVTSSGILPDFDDLRGICLMATPYTSLITVHLPSEVCLLLKIFELDNHNTRTMVSDRN